MIFTHDELREALTLLEQRAPSIEHGTIDSAAARAPGVRHIRSRVARRWLAPACASAVVIAVTAGALSLAAAHDSSSRENAGGPRASTITPKPVALAFGFRVAAVTGYDVQLSDSGPGYQDATGIYHGPRASNSVGFDIRVYAQGVYNATRAKAGAPMHVNGHTAYFGQLPAEGGGTSATLTWQYAPNSWANVEQNGPVDASFKQIALNIAEAVRVGGSQPLLLPFHLGYVPAGLVPGYATSMTYFTPGDGAVAFVDNVATPWTESGALNIDVYPTPAPGSASLCAKMTTKITIAGYAGCRGSSKAAGIEYRLTVPGGRLYIQVDPAHVARYSDAEIRKLVAGMTFAPSIKNSSTWFDGRSVLP